MLSLILACCLAADYDAAYAKAQSENKPLVVLVGAPWCPACLQMKPLLRDLRDVVTVYVDQDEQPELAAKLLMGDQLPQIIVFSKTKDRWNRHWLKGLQSRERVRDLIKRALSP